jgi:UDP-glucose 4-epimerase
MRIIVTGGAGFIGSHVADALLERAHEVLVLDDLSSGRRENVPARATFVQGDIRDAATVAKVWAEFQPDVVSHQAAQTSVAISAREPLRDAEINVLGSLNIFQACALHRTKKVVFASTGGAIYGEVPDGKRATTDWMPNPLSPYACSKFAVENYLNAYAHERGLKSTVLRYANVYGPRQDPHGEAGVVAIFTQRVLAGEPIQINARKVLGDDGCVRDYVYVGDVVKANLLAIEDKLPRSPVNVCTGDATTTLALARMLETVTQKPLELRQGARREGDVERSVLEPATTLLGQPVSLREGLDKTVAWFRQRGA